ncbi:unnamed protein product [Heligmosomoides polygyrus]|uniref:Transmembrane protein n=1 Tax=Heligmosomoides polygyrus TaxID=6339 RepID=A0A183F9V9_HELPZ|nr:unnamed protein product [Heligmosomoides polygyrus]
MMTMMSKASEMVDDLVNDAVMVMVMPFVVVMAVHHHYSWLWVDRNWLRRWRSVGSVWSIGIWLIVAVISVEGHRSSRRNRRKWLITSAVSPSI